MAYFTMLYNRLCVTVCNRVVLASECSNGVLCILLLHQESHPHFCDVFPERLLPIDSITSEWCRVVSSNPYVQVPRGSTSRTMHTLRVPLPLYYRGRERGWHWW